MHVTIREFDSGYRNELGIIITNTSQTCCSTIDKIFEADTIGNNQGTYRIRKGDRIAQLVLQEVPRIRFNRVGSVDDIGNDRGGGFGSTGVNGG